MTPGKYNELLKIIVSKALISSTIIIAFIRIKDVVENDKMIIAILPDASFDKLHKKIIKNLPRCKDIRELRALQPTLRFLPILLYPLEWLSKGRVSIHDWTIYMLEDSEYCEILYLSKGAEEVVRKAIENGRLEALESLIELLQLFVVKPTPEDTDILHYCLELIFALRKMKGEKIPDDLEKLLRTFRGYYATGEEATEEEARQAYEIIKAEVKRWTGRNRF